MAKQSKSTGQFIQQGQTTDHLYGSDPSPKSVGGADGNVETLKP